MDNDLISRSALFEEIEGIYKRHYEKSCYQFIHDFFKAIFRRINKAPAVDAVPIEKLGKIGKLFLPYKGCPRGRVGRMGEPYTLEDEALFWGVIEDVDGGRWVPVVEAVLHELIEKARNEDG